MYTFSLDAAFTEATSGAKAFHLAKMKKAGFTIPDGFVVSSQAFGEFYLTNTPVSEQLKEEISIAFIGRSSVPRHSAGAPGGLQS